MASWCFLFGVVLFASSIPAQKSSLNEIPHDQVENWATNFGVRLWSGCQKMTLENRIDKNYNHLSNKQQRMNIIKKEGSTVAKQMAEDIQSMLEYKIIAVNRIMENAEQAALEYREDDSIRLKYFNAAHLGEKGQEMDLEPSEHFGEDVNKSQSVIHVPKNVYDHDKEVLNSIKWSNKLDKIFQQNYREDPTLNWQYFGSSTGFLRQYPASEWKFTEEEMEVDEYDARMRSWYIEAASSPKDMVILLDISGSMTGLRKEIAKHVVLNILDTLNANDYVQIYAFNVSVMPLVKCFDGRLVQATLTNVREFKNAIDEFETENIANFSAALTKAFELLHKANISHEGAQCNQAIMLITDGAPYNYKEIFQKYNWPQCQVRVFTYLIGREVTDIREVKWMACANKGYFVHVATLAEVKEQVQKYIPVLARPMVLYQNIHPFIWTHVYADKMNPKSTDWQFEVRQRNNQRKRTKFYRELKKKTIKPEYYFHNITYFQENFLRTGDFNKSDPEPDPDETPLLKLGRGQSDPHKRYRLMTTVATPVFDLRNTSMRTARLLGVAGTDVPISEFLKLTPQYKLGVNGYSFLVTNNGYVLFHPDLRPILRPATRKFKEILKPSYGSVDLAELELVDTGDDDEPRANDSRLLMLRKDMVNQKQMEVEMPVKQHLDGMKRVIRRNMKYFYHPIGNTTFSLGIAWPADYGKYALKAEIEIKRRQLDHNDMAQKYFEGKNWKVHPHWVYCRYRYEDAEKFESPEKELLHFINRAYQANWNWHSTRMPSPPKPGHGQDNRGQRNGKPYYCDKELVQSLVFDAKATDVFNDNGSAKYDFLNNGETCKPYRAFVATRSGLLRWTDYGDKDSNSSSSSPHWADLNNKAIEETWYKRAVDYYNIDKNSYVFSVPFNAGSSNNTLVTATHAVFFKSNDGREAPVAVVGIQFKHSTFQSIFLNVTTMCTDSACPTTCNSEELHCYVLDDSGFVIVSENTKDIGKFFGEVDGMVMDSFIQDKIYETVKVYDYQGVCLRQVPTAGIANMLLTPFKHIQSLLLWLWGRTIWVIAQTGFVTWWNPDSTWAQTDLPTAQFPDPFPEPETEIDIDDGAREVSEEHTLEEDDYIAEPEEELNYKVAFIKKKRPEPCDKQVDLYMLNYKKFNADSDRTIKGKLTNCNPNGCERPFSVQKVKNTNMVLVVAMSDCPCNSKVISVEPEEIKYVENDTMACDRLQVNIFRKRPESCINYHPEEEEIELCGGGAGLTSSLSVLLLLLLLLRIHSCS